MGNKGYISTGLWYDTLINYTWEYDFTRDLWIEKTPFEGPVTAGATGFSINNRGYLLTGKTGINQTHNQISLGISTGFGSKSE